MSFMDGFKAAMDGWVGDQQERRWRSGPKDYEVFYLDRDGRERWIKTVAVTPAEAVKRVPRGGRLRGVKLAFLEAPVPSESDRNVTEPGWEERGEDAGSAWDRFVGASKSLAQFWGGRR